MATLELEIIGYFVVMHRSDDSKAESILFVNATADQTTVHPWHQPTFAADRRDVVFQSDRPDAVYPEFESAWSMTDTVLTVATRSGPIHADGAAFTVTEETVKEPANPGDPKSWENGFWLADLRDGLAVQLRQDWRTSPAAAARLDFRGGTLVGGKPHAQIRSKHFQIGSHSKVRAMTDRVTYRLEADTDRFEITLSRPSGNRRIWLRTRDQVGLVHAALYSFPMSEHTAHEHAERHGATPRFEHFSGYFELTSNPPSDPLKRFLFERKSAAEGEELQDGPSCVSGRFGMP